MDNTTKIVEESSRLIDVFGIPQRTEADTKRRNSARKDFEFVVKQEILKALSSQKKAIIERVTEIDIIYTNEKDRKLWNKFKDQIIKLIKDI